ncbi:MAG: tyrosine-type recombinase/integrase [Candidatus Dormibacteraeota bacterium]|nr:tyrosine-type recombinase/integrase [Candidatus Dormibacteraeota bacterium]
MSMGVVFLNKVGQPIEARNLLRKFKAHLRRAGLADRPFHALRHSAATFLLLQGVEMKVVQEILGHSNLGTTADRYSHVLARMKREAVDRLTGCGWLADKTGRPGRRGSNASLRPGSGHLRWRHNSKGGLRCRAFPRTVPRKAVITALFSTGPRTSTVTR